mgnify:CR=1 FL=1
MLTIGSEAMFKMDDSADPGFARVKLLEPHTLWNQQGEEWKLWNIEILEVTKPSVVEYWVGQRLRLVGSEYLSPISEACDAG